MSHGLALAHNAGFVPLLQALRKDSHTVVFVSVDDGKHSKLCVDCSIEHAERLSRLKDEKVAEIEQEYSEDFDGMIKGWKKGKTKVELQGSLGHRSLRMFGRARLPSPPFRGVSAGSPS